VKFHMRCPYCPRKFESSKKDRWTFPRLKGSLQIHIKANHPEHYVPKKPKRVVDIVATALHPDKKKVVYFPETKRPYTRKPKTTAPVMEVNHCPQCGCNIRAVKVAMGL